MAMFHTRMSVVQRSQGKSSVAGAAYDSRSALTDERTGIHYDFRRAHRHERLVADLGVSLPAGAPQALSDRSYLWNEIERVEKSGLAQTARRVECSLPRCLTEQEQVALAESIVGYFVDQGMVVDASIHDALDGHNPHLHMQMALRPVGPDGFMPKSVNVYTVRNADGHEEELTATELKERLAAGETWEKLYTYRLGKEKRLLTPTEAEGWTGCKRQGRSPIQSTRYLVDWNDRSNAKKWRKAIADMTNEALAQNGADESVDSRSYAEQGIDLIPMLHEGTAVVMDEKANSGIEPVTDRRKENLRIKEANKKLKAMAKRMAELLEALELLKKLKKMKAAKKNRTKNDRQRAARPIKQMGSKTRSRQVER